jgi:hypothetical protein
MSEHQEELKRLKMALVKSQDETSSLRKGAIKVGLIMSAVLFYALETGLAASVGGDSGSNAYYGR